MDELIPIGDLPEMTKEEAEEIDAQLKAGASELAFGLYLIKCRKGYRKLGFSSFEEYCDVNYNMARQTADDWMCRVRVALIARGLTVAEFSKMYALRTFSSRLLPRDTSRVLSKLETKDIAEGWKILDTSGAFNLKAKEQIDQLERWMRRQGLIETTTQTRRVVQDDADEEGVLWCSVCQKVRCVGSLNYCSDCWEAKQATDANRYASSDNMVDNFMEVQTVSAPQLPAAPAPVVGVRVQGDTVERVDLRFASPASDVPAYLRQTPPDGLKDNGRQVIPAVMAIETDDPEIIYVRCVVPEGMSVQSGQLMTVAIVRCQLP